MDPISDISQGNPYFSIPKRKIRNVSSQVKSQENCSVDAWQHTTSKRTQQPEINTRNSRASMKVVNLYKQKGI